MWRSFEHIRLDPRTGTSVWLTNHAYPHLAVLMDSGGPFRECTPTRHRDPEHSILPLIAPPEGLFTPENS